MREPFRVDGSERFYVSMFSIHFRNLSECVFSSIDWWEKLGKKSEFGNTYNRIPILPSTKKKKKKKREKKRASTSDLANFIFILVKKNHNFLF